MLPVVQQIISHEKCAKSVELYLQTLPIWHLLRYNVLAYGVSLH